MNSKSLQSVAQAIWPWRVSKAPPLTAGGPGGHKRRALIQAFVMTAVATLMTLVGQKIWLGMAIYGLSAILIVTAFLIIPWFHALERAGQWLGHMVAQGLAWLLLAPFFYLCFTPGRLALKLMGKDPMTRRYDPTRHSYWVDHKPGTNPQPYTKQY